MTDILDLPEARDLVPRLTVQDYHVLGDSGLIDKRTELIRGIVIRKVSKSPLQSSISIRLYDRISALALEGLSVWRDDPLTFIDSEPEPDISIVCGSRREFDQAHPRTGILVIEVAVSSASLDRANATLYAENGVQEHWIVLAKRKEVEVYRKPQEGVYQEKFILAGEAVALCEHIPAIAIPLRDIFF